ncbi:ketopantoate reductase family protein [Pseudocolwellia sp. HL-MZ19]|uniref:ketopantoate reductase family protein n=1 Tax=Pseudocolwellia sp. HL-MZ19 TaxID=3400846 RepID=UPI003CF820DE
MNFLIIGAGGIGCFYGAKLQIAGHHVTFLSRGEHLYAMQQSGLEVEHKESYFSDPVEALDIDALIKNKVCDHYDLIMLTTKGGATASILEQLDHWLSNSETPFLSLQNGVDNEPLISKAIGEERTLGGLAVRIGGHIIEPGKVHATGAAQLIIGAWPNVENCSIEKNNNIEKLIEVFVSAEISTQLSLNIKQELWRKLLINNGVNPLSAITGLNTGELTSHKTLTLRVYEMMEEVASVAKADDVVLSKQDIDEMYELICTFDPIKTSMLIDKEKGRPLELDSICGAVLRRSEKLGIQTPITQLVNDLLILN